MIKFISTLLLVGSFLNSGFAQEAIETNNEDIFKSEVQLGDQSVTGHGQHMAFNASGESNFNYGQTHLQLLPFQVNIYTHYQSLSDIEIQNLKITTLNFMMDQYHVGFGAPSFSNQNLGYGDTKIHTQTFSPLTGTAFHKLSYNEGKLVVNISGFISVPGKAYGFGQNTQDVFSDDIDKRLNFNDGTYIPAGAKVGMNFDNKIQVGGSVDYQRFSSTDVRKTISPVARTVTTNTMVLNDLKFSASVTANLGNLLTQKLKGVNLYASISSQNLNYKLNQDKMTLIRMDHGTQRKDERSQPQTLSNQSFVNVQVGISVDIHAKKKLKK